MFEKIKKIISRLPNEIKLVILFFFIELLKFLPFENTFLSFYSFFPVYYIVLFFQVCIIIFIVFIITKRKWLCILLVLVAPFTLDKLKYFDYYVISNSGVGTVFSGFYNLKSSNGSQKIYTLWPMEYLERKENLGVELCPARDFKLCEQGDFEILNKDTVLNKN